eukprot:507742-Pelagomonas_calceolata.AAC.7
MSGPSDIPRLACPHLVGSVVNVIPQQRSSSGRIPKMREPEDLSPGASGRPACVLHKGLLPTVSVLHRLVILVHAQHHWHYASPSALAHSCQEKSCELLSRQNSQSHEEGQEQSSMSPSWAFTSCWSPSWAFASVGHLAGLSLLLVTKLGFRFSWSPSWAFASLDH